MPSPGSDRKNISAVSKDEKDRALKTSRWEMLQHHLSQDRLPDCACSTPTFSATSRSLCLIGEADAETPRGLRQAERFRLTCADVQYKYVFLDVFGVTVDVCRRRWA